MRNPVHSCKSKPRLHADSKQQAARIAEVRKMADSFGLSPMWDATDRVGHASPKDGWLRYPFAYLDSSGGTSTHRWIAHSVLPDSSQLRWRHSLYIPILASQFSESFRGKLLTSVRGESISRNEEERTDTKGIIISRGGHKTTSPHYWILYSICSCADRLIPQKFLPGTAQYALLMMNRITSSNTFLQPFCYKNGALGS